jgi:hypothetical protein
LLFSFTLSFTILSKAFTGASMVKVFNKDDPALLSIYDEALKTWELSGDHEKVCMAVNLRCDHRVTSAREQLFRDYFLKNQDLKEALDEYVRHCVKLSPSPHFCEPWCDNLVADAASGEHCENYDGSKDLATVLSLNGLSYPIKDTYPRLMDEMIEWRELIDVETQASDEQSKPTPGANKFDKWLEKNLKDKTLGQVESFLDKIFKVLNHRLTIQNEHYNPVWVSTWENFEAYARLGADRWNQVVGVPRITPTWQIVLRYPPGIVPCLHRPSQLDGGYYPQHFPTPPVTTMAEGGLTMDLGASINKPLNEYIHRQVKLDIQYWIDGGRLIGKTGVTPDELPQVRHHHYERLLGVYEEATIREWMPQPI